jgi:sialate O-acetylesterase
MDRILRLLVCTILLPACLVARAEINLSNAFTRCMVLQRAAKNPVFGTADPGATVTVSFAGQTKDAVADKSGNWLVWLDPMPASDNGTDLLVQSGGIKQAVQGVVVGDVWLLIGDYSLVNRINNDEKKMIAGDNEPFIRQYLCRMDESPYPRDSHPMNSMYLLAGKKNLAKFPIIPYMFAKEIRGVEKVPVGFMNASGRMDVLGILPPLAYKYMKDPGNAKLVESMKVSTHLSPEGKKAYSEYVAAMRDWVEESRQRVERGLFPRPYPEIPHGSISASKQYNARIHPIHRFPIKGILWHHHDRANYQGGISQMIDIYRALVLGLREAFNNPDLPFYIVQQHHSSGAVSNPAQQNMLPLIQSEMLKLPNIGIAVTYDLHNYKSWDLNNGYDAGRRLALWALRDVYAQEDVEPQGPTFQKMTVEGNKVIVEFHHIGPGLMVGGKEDYKKAVPDPRGRLGGFIIAGADKKWQWAEAEIVGDHVRVWSDAVSAPVHVAYAVNNSPNKPNLYSRNGLPALPFKHSVK